MPSPWLMLSPELEDIQKMNAAITMTAIQLAIGALRPRANASRVDGGDLAGLFWWVFT